ncbi:hypothetical protein N5079_07915 [Planotetraspora sp. A-T 1434]|uniref:hypothetical protein n=1 Tax=Planotetraspora sp. A-T 1434 TaxID=2979219 RepID=UPI0021C1DF71|nr:hypothetical protein [Planotetraspora sp. A-T 1434]MCT9930149.1 hypothetical protein [Planotetraspora sp. A-T 1434]
MRNRNTLRRRTAFAAMLLGSTALAVLPADAAFAGPSCTVAGCSTTFNDSPMEAWAYFNWCRKGDSTGAWTVSEPTCTSGGASQDTFYLDSGGHTPLGQDWDAFRVDAGWCYRVKFVVSFGSDFTRTYDRRGQSAAWVKVADNADAHILAQTNTSPC